MPQVTDKHYADFGGLDTTTNLLKMDPKTQRRGSKNFRYNNDDQLTQRLGFQHITDTSNAFKFGLAEYKYRDLDTGEAKSEILGVGSDGFLYKRRNHRLKIVRSSGTVKYYSIFYNGTNWTFALYDSAMAVVFSTTYDNSFVVTQLVSAINTAAITGIAASAVDEDGTAVTSTVLAYLLTTVIAKEFNTSITDTEYIPAYYAEIVTTPSSSALFPEVLDSAITSLPDFEGLTSTNLNNCIYLTCGGFPIKYDSKSAYRAGVPAVLPQVAAGPVTPSNASGIAAASTNVFAYWVFTISAGSATAGATYTNRGVTFTVYATVSGATSVMMSSVGSPQSSGTLTKASGTGDATLTFSAVSNSTTLQGTYRYKFRHGFIDSNGAEYLGDVLNSNFYGPNDFSMTIAITGTATQLTYYGYKNDSRFPVYACKVNGAQNIALAGGTFNVDSGHNILAGMLLQIPVNNDLTLTNGYSFIITKVTSVTSTAITVAQGMTSGTYPFAMTSLPTTLLIDNQIIQAGYRESAFENTITDIGPGTQVYHPQSVVGSFLRVYRTKEGQSLGPYYKALDLPLPLGAMGSTTFNDTVQDANLTEEFDDSEGGPLPRACRYIGQWQKQLVQGGRPYDTTLKDDYYPSYYATTPLLNAWGEPSTYNRFYLNEETALCDFQSVYWTDPLNAEAFPTSGLYEEDFQGQFSDQIRGFGENKKALFVGKDRTIGLLAGTLATNDITKEILETEAGLSSHNSMQEVAGSLMWLDGISGFWSCVAGRLPVYIGWKIQDDFRKNGKKAKSEKLLPSRAKAATFKLDSQYICFIPAGYIENGETGSATEPTSSSIMFVYDFAQTEKGPRSCWYSWQGVYPNGGILATSNDELIFSQNMTVSIHLWQQKRTGTKYDMTDHNAAIEFNAKNAWLNYGTPTIDKDFVNSWINSVEGGFTLTVQQYYNYMDTVASSYNVTMPTGTSKVSVKKSANLNVPKLSAISLGFYHNTKNELVTIDGWEVVLAQDYDPGEPKI